MSGNSEGGISSLSNNYQSLEKKGLIDSFVGWLKTASELNANDSNQFKNNLKLILIDLVDTHLQSTSKVYQSSSLVKKSAAKTRASKTKRSRKTSEVVIPSVQPQSSRSFKRMSSSLVSEDFINDMSNIKGCATFYKSTKKFSLIGERTPGPADYCPKSMMKQSPRIMIPVSGTRVEFASKASPGPAAYSPRVHFQAKKLR